MKYLLAALFFVGFSLTASAQECGPQKDIIEVLARQYGERPIGFGVVSNGQMLQVFVNDRTGSWTVVVVTPERVACLVAAGEGWQDSTGPGL